MKVCKYCRRELPDEAFQVCKMIGGKVYYRQKCRHCKRVVTNQRRAAIRLWLANYKKSSICVRCGFTDYRALEFHHHRRDGKDFNVADMVRLGSSIKNIQREIEKCIMLCSNCHQIEHYNKNKLR